MVRQWRGYLFLWIPLTPGLAGYDCAPPLLPTHPPYHSHLYEHSEEAAMAETLYYPLTVVFRDELKWWSGVELGRRFLFLLFFIPFPRITATPTLILATVITVYGFAQPYKSLMANILEMGVQVNFLLLLLIEATSDIRDLYFTFPPLLQSNSRFDSECVDSPTGIAPITWILMPFYYLPLLVFPVVACVYLVFYIRRKFLQKPLDDSEPEAIEYHHHTREVFFQSLRFESSQSGFVTLTNQSETAEGINTS